LHVQLLQRLWPEAPGAEAGKVIRNLPAKAFANQVPGGLAGPKAPYRDLGIGAATMSS